MMSSTLSASEGSRHGQPGAALATLIFLLDISGLAPADGAVAQALAAVKGASEEEADAAGQAFAAQMDALLGGEASAEKLLGVLQALYGVEAFERMEGGDRPSRLAAILQQQFRSSRPWLARIVDRFPGGELRAHWVLVQHVAEEVICFDPYPWDGVDEEHRLPVVDFMVKWELAGQEAIRWKLPAR
jgi:hypothetical protein